ncbi:MAG TPA: polysaccharide biosynthesis tyrosine autokinase [Pyrinomonadaceae bacterium]|nr:polysaccharide biosynthesis tyrosine autokinase [Pyrinomonadaceae bacterium]
MISQDNRLMPLSPEPLDRPLRDLAQPVPVAVQNEPTHLREYLAIVLKRKWLILSLVVVVTSLVAIQMYRLPSVYEAMAVIQIEQRNAGNVLSTGRGVDQLIIRTDSKYWNTQFKKLTTQKLARQVILRLDLHNNPQFLGAQRGTGIIAALRRAVTGKQAAPPAKPDRSVPVVTDTEINADSVPPELAVKLEPYEAALRANLVVGQVENTNLANISFRHTNPELASAVANTIATVFRENDIREQATGSQRAEDVLAKEIVDLQARIQANEQRRVNYLQSHDLPLGEKAGQDLNADRLRNYSSQLQDAEKQRKLLEAAYQTALSTRSTAGIWAIPEVQNDPTVKRLREQISKLDQERAALLVNYTPEWPGVQKLDRQITRLKEELEAAPDEIINGMKSRYESAVANERQINASYFSERGRANTASIAERGLKDLDQAIETDRQNLNLYMQRLNEVKITQPQRVEGNITLVEEARTPRAPIGPPRVRNIAIALLLSLFVGVGLAFLLDYLDDTLKSVEDVDRHLHLPTLALIPAPRETRRLLGRSAAPPPSGEPATALALIEDVRSPVAEAYRHLRTSLLLSSAGQPPKTILVTSSQPSEGKTTTVVNIATMLAQTGAEVLVLDCDLRRPRVHAHFGLPNARGVTNCLSGEANVSELLQTYERMPNLKVLTSGPVPPNSAELLGSDEMRRLLYLLSEHFTHIVIDSPPAISFTDASILSTMVDGVMLVVHGGRSSRTVVRRAKQQLQDVGAHIFGVVLNNVKLEGNDYYYYSGYYSGYYAPAEEDEAPGGAEAAGRAGAR